MIHCTINNTVVYPDTSEKIKVTYENEYVNESGDYTYEVSFPMGVAANQQFFGRVDRMDVKKNLPEYEDCKLYSSGKLLISGKGTVMSISESTVKIQIVGGSSRINSNSKLQSHYIDEITYDDVVITKGLNADFSGIVDLGGVTADAALAIDLSSDTFVGEPWVAVFNPIYNETEDKTCNLITNPEYRVAFKIYNAVGEVESTTGGNRERSFMHNLAVQPFLNYVVSKVLSHEGYKLTENYLNQDPWNKLVIANCHQTVKINEALPHWTVYKFISEIRKLFSVSFIFDDQNKTVKIVGQNEITSQGTVNYDCSDEFTAEYDEDGLSSVISSNVAYNMGSSAYREWTEVLELEVQNAYETVEYDSLEEMKTAAEAMTERERRTKIFKVGDNQYIYAVEPPLDDPENEDEEENLFLVGYFSPFVRDSESDEEEEIDIAPVAMAYLKRDDIKGEDSSLSDWIRGTAYVRIPSSEDNYVETESSVDEDGEYYTSVKDAIDNGVDEDEEEDEDVMYLMFQADTKYTVLTREMNGNYLDVPHPVNYTDYRMLNVESDSEKGSLSLANFEELGIVDKNYEVTIEFVTEEIPDPKKIYVFHGKRYLCTKIEMNVTDDGVDQVKTGYFYELL